MQVIPWSPLHLDRSFADLRSELDSMVRSFFGNGSESRLPEVFTRRAFPACNVAETEKDVTITVDLPGLTEKDVTVQLMGNQLTISGERKWEEEKKGKEFHRVESQYGSFQRTITLPDRLRTEPDAIVAVVSKGVLEVKVPKVEPTPTAKIQVKAR